MIRLDNVEQKILHAAEFARLRAFRELEQGEDAGFMCADLEAAGENMILAAQEIRRRLEGSHGD